MPFLSDDEFANAGAPTTPKVMSDQEFQSAGAPQKGGLAGAGDYISEQFNNPSGGASLIGMAGNLYRGVRGALGTASKLGSGEIDPSTPEGSQQAMEVVPYVLPTSPAMGTGRAIARSVLGDTYREAAPTAVTPEAIAAQKAADEFSIKLSRGQATGDDIRFEDLSARGAYGEPAKKVAQPFFDQQFQDIGEAGRGIGEGLARDQNVAATPQEAASTLGTEVGSVATRAQQLRDQAAAQAAQDAEATRGIVRDQERVIGEAVQGGSPAIENQREAGEVVGQQVRTQAAQDRGAYQARYGEAMELPGQFDAEAFQGVGARIQEGLSQRAEPVIIDDVTTPIASRAIRDIDNISNLRIQNRADPAGAPNPDDIVGIDLRGVDQARKRLVAFYRAARGSGNAADARAAGALIDEFDNQVEGAMANGLFSGDPQALTALQQARAAYSSYARRYRPQQAGDDVGAAMRRIIDRQATPEEIANMITGSGRLGNAGLPVRLADRLEEVLGQNSDAWSSIRQALWQRASQVRNAAGEVDPARSAQSILDFTGSTLGQRMLSPQERAVMRAHAQGVRNLDQLIEQLPSTQAAARTQRLYEQAFGGEGIGGAQQAAFRRIVDGSATPDEITQTVFSSIAGGKSGNTVRLIDAIERIAGPQSEAMAAVRQGVWQKLTQVPIGVDQPGQQKLAQSIYGFLGSAISRRLYSDNERFLMKRYADVVKKTVIGKYDRTNSDTTPALMGMLNRYGSAIATTIGAGVEAVTGGLGHGLIGAATGYGVGKMIEKGATAVRETGSARRVGKQFNWLDNAPATPVRMSPPGPTPRLLTPPVGRALPALGSQATPRALPPPSPPVANDDRRRQLAEGRAHGGRVNPLNINHTPTEAQKQAGNYAKDHVKIHGMDIAIENARGAKRSGVDKGGKPWSVKMPAHYGYIKKTEGKDGDHVDVYLGPHIKSPKVYIIDQIKDDTRAFDEHKCFIGFPSKSAVIATYHKAFSDGKGPDRFGHITEMPIDQFKKWLESGDTKKPLRYEKAAA